MPSEETVAAVEEIEAVVAGLEGEVPRLDEGVDNLLDVVGVDDAVWESGDVRDRGVRVQPRRCQDAERHIAHSSEQGRGVVHAGCLALSRTGRPKSQKLR